MKETLSDLWSLASVLIGAALFVAILWWAANTHARMWRSVSERSPGAAPDRIVAKRLETIVIARRGTLGPGLSAAGLYRQYAGTVLGVTSTGLTVSAVWPLSMVCPSFAIPFDRMDLQRTSWALWDEPFALRLRGQPDHDVIVGRDTVQWIRAHTDRKPFGFG